jgi:hypothetical protein
MNPLQESSAKLEGKTESIEQQVRRLPGFFDQADWLGFWITAGIALVAYSWTLAPEVTLERSGIFATGAAYAGVSPPPGFPLWTLYAWLFTKIFPFSNIAWRIAFSSAFAGAFCCAVISLTVSRASQLLLKRTQGWSRSSQIQQHWLRVVCGNVAGLGFAFHNEFWGQAVIVECTALGMLLFAIALCLLLRWVCVPRQFRYLYTAVFMYGLSVAVSYTFIAAAAGLLGFVVLARPALGRDLCFTLALILPAVVIGQARGVVWEWFESLRGIYIAIAIVAGIVALDLIVKSRRLFTEWRATLLISGILLLPLSFYLTLPIASMTNPPGNWGYARTFEGFMHTTSRGQYEHFYPIDVFGEPSRFFMQAVGFVRESWRAIGWPYLMPVPIPFFFLHRMRKRERNWLSGLALVFLSSSLLIMIALNPPPDRSALSFMIQYFQFVHLLLIILSGCGLAIIAGRMSNLTSTRRVQSNQVAQVTP